MFKKMVENNENPFVISDSLKILADNMFDKILKSLLISQVDHDLFTKIYNQIKINKCNCKF